MSAPKKNPSELPISTIVNWFDKQKHFPPAIEVGPQTLMNWMKAMNTNQTDNRLSTKIGKVLRRLQKKAGITKAQSMAYIEANGENLDAPVLYSAFHQNPLSRSVKARKKRQQKKAKREAQAKENADARARAKAKSKSRSESESEEDAEEFSEWEGFSDDDGEVMDVELSQPFPLKVVTSAPATNTSL
ncbi:hypothetical protein KCU81_g3937, partial [Aureobasidium melanogenum]|uniref:Uncharacterized protein n=1 Tax=Aureobasidium melanogenum (strain CBS 110374) TaxID=1043003 RepID=A0A074VTD3_AURM1